MRVFWDPVTVRTVGSQASASCFYDASNPLDINRVTKMMTSTISPSESAQDVGAGFRPKEKELSIRERTRVMKNGISFIVAVPDGLAGQQKLDTGKTLVEKAKLEQEEIGTKRIFVFYIGRTPRGERTGWIIHEYTAAFNLPNQRAFVLCKLFKKRMPVTGEVELSRKMAACSLENQNSYQKTNNSAFDEGETSHLMTFENQATDFAIQEEAHSQPIPHLGSFYDCNEQNHRLNSALNSPMQDFTCDDLWDFSFDA
ncbi:hypothetical protein GH714_020342 [Hevea brasiliensis]|uniref:NAC domain-containing protein n=1 Tax=Hevea brasiliensis TaxID=3981 RepID=A0A6A6M223_HEVBR|nr:hypothetical protein GH714_020342 [Hevea brasiliensis]